MDIVNFAKKREWEKEKKREINPRLAMTEWMTPFVVQRRCDQMNDSFCRSKKEKKKKARNVVKDDK